MANISNPTFIVSLDFELYWGVLDNKTISEYRKNLEGVHDVVPKILELFQKYNIHATWATVGFLFFDSLCDLKGQLPDAIPQYELRKLSPFLYIKGNSELENKLHFAPELIMTVKATPNQEIGSHTFSHFYCLEEPISRQAFESDTKSFNQIASSNSISSISIVFPRNQYSNQHLDIVAQNGYLCYRGNEKNKAFSAQKSETYFSFKNRLLRSLDSYINIYGDQTYKIDDTQKPINLPSSRFFKPYSNSLSFLEGLKVRRIKTSMTHAAKQNEVFHLWWHPHNFGINIEENIKQLEEILQHFTSLKTKYSMQSLNMGEVAQIIQDGKR